jgi:hypothetical protein
MGWKSRMPMMAGVALAMLPLIGDAGADQPVGKGPNGSTTVEMIGHGLDACSVWLDQHRGRTEIAQRQDAWLLGFTSAFNVYSQNITIRLPDATEQVSYVTAWCKDHPTEAYATAALWMVVELGIHEAAH